MVGAGVLRDALDGSVGEVGEVGEVGAEDTTSDDTGFDDCVPDDWSAPAASLALDVPAPVSDPTCAAPATVVAQPAARTVTAVASAAITDARLTVPTTPFTRAPPTRRQ